MKNRCAKHFVIHGNNGGSFFFAVNSFRDWLISLEFYRTVSLEAVCKKIVLIFAYPFFKAKARVLTDELPVKLESNSSAIISPTRDKFIIHQHGLGYSKIAHGKSLRGVTNELAFYQLLAEKAPRTFAFSKIKDFEVSEESVKFTMLYADGKFSNKIPEIEELIEVLVEFFQLNSRFDGTQVVGTVHRDFKPWNVKTGTKPLLFDFESIAYDGLPLEDLFNYCIDPMLRTQSAKECYDFAQKKLFLHAKNYLTLLGIDSCNVKKYWLYYLKERADYWQNSEKNLSDKFLELYEISR